MSFLITIGSPALAAYSLQITHLNSRWITKAFLDVDYPNSKHIAAVLSAFHHIPIRVSYHPPFLHSLVVLHKNDGFWCRLFAAAKKTRRWSIPLCMNFVLVIFAAILTVLDSIYSPRPGDIGYAIAATWTFLLPLIIGWLRVGCEPEPNHLRDSLAIANKKAWVATTRRDTPAKSNLAIEFMKAEDVDPARKDELKTVPVFNYSRAFVSPLTAELILGLAKNAAANAKQEIPAGNLTGRGPPAWTKNKGGTISDENRIGTDSQVTEYCTKVLLPLESGSSPITPLDSRPSEKTNATNSLLPLHGPYSLAPISSRWAAGIWKRVAISTVLALGLQWGTVGAAILIHYMAPPAGLGCRAFSFLLYGVAGTTSFFYFLASSILAHVSRPHQGQEHEDDRSWLRGCQEAGAIVCRWLGKSIAILSAMGILLVCFFQITGAFNTCFCNSTTFDKGRGSVVFLTINYVITPAVFRVWIGGLVVAVSTAVLYGFSIYLSRPPRR